MLVSESWIRLCLPAWLGVCDLTDEKEKQLYSVLIDRQVEIYETRKLYKQNKSKQIEETSKIRENYLPKLEKVVGKDNIRLMEEFWQNQIGSDMKDLMDAMS